MAASVTFGSATARNLCDGLMGQRGWHVDTLKKWTSRQTSLQNNGILSVLLFG